MRGRLENIKDQYVVFLTTIGLQEDNKAKARQKIITYAQEHQLDKGTVYGIIYGNPAVTPKEQCRYDACISVFEQSQPETDEYELKIIEGGKYIVFEIEQTKEAMERAWIDMFPEVMKKGYAFDMSRLIVERFSSQKVEKNCYEVMIPV